MGTGSPGLAHRVLGHEHSSYLGGQVDIHGGGSDLIFPHHENEIAQMRPILASNRSRATGFTMAWSAVGTEKMSKSLGNFVPLRVIVDRGLAPAFRLMVLQSHYRAPLTYTEEGLLGAERGLDRLRAAAAISPDTVAGEDETPAAIRDLSEFAEETRCRFHEAMDDDFDAPEATAALFELARSINRARGQAEAAERIEPARATLVELAAILGLDLEDQGSMPAVEAAPFIDLLLRVRDELRQRKEWALSDLIRDELGKRGVVVEDTPTGATWSRRKG